MVPWLQITNHSRFVELLMFVNFAHFYVGHKRHYGFRHQCLSTLRFHVVCTPFVPISHSVLRRIKLVFWTWFRLHQIWTPFVHKMSVWQSGELCRCAARYFFPIYWRPTTQRKILSPGSVRNKIRLSERKFFTHGRLRAYTQATKHDSIKTKSTEIGRRNESDAAAFVND